MNSIHRFANRSSFFKASLLAFVLGGFAPGLLRAQTDNAEATNAPGPAPAETNAAPATPVLQIDAGKVTGNVSPTLYGLMTEEINYSYEGGLYGELVRNRTFKANAQNPVFWNAINGSISLDTTQPLNAALNVSLKLDVSKASKDSPVGIANGGFWGIPVRPNTTYHASFYAKGRHFNGPLTVSLVHVVDSNNVTVKTPPGVRVFPGEMTETLATATIPKISGDWKKYEVTLTTGSVETSKNNRLVISTTKPGTFFNKHGTVWFDAVSLFPPTYNNRPNGTRPDIMQLLADMQPKFLRFPGGNYVEGNTHCRTFQLEGNHWPGSQTSRPPQPVGLLVHRRLGSAGISGMVRGFAHGAGAGRLCRLLAARTAYCSGAET